MVESGGYCLDGKEVTVASESLARCFFCKKYFKVFYCSLRPCNYLCFKGFKIPTIRHCKRVRFAKRNRPFELSKRTLSQCRLAFCFSVNIIQYLQPLITVGRYSRLAWKRSSFLRQRKNPNLSSPPVETWLTLSYKRNCIYSSLQVRNLRSLNY